MAAQITIERILRDDNDDTGQSVRDWKIQCEAGWVTLRERDGRGFLLLRTADVDLFMADLKRAKETALSLSAEAA